MVTANLEITDELLKKLKGLLNLSNPEKNSNVNEAAAAAAKLQELMFKYNLSLSHITASDNKDAVDTKMDAARFRPDTVGRYIWNRDLLTVITKNNFCYEVENFVITKSGTRSYRGSTIIGQPHNIEFVQYLYEYLRKEMYRLASESYQEAKHAAQSAGHAPPHSWTYFSSFCRGAVATIALRLSRQFQADKDANADTMALVVVNDAALEKFASQMFPEMKKYLDKAKRDVADIVAYRNGVKAAQGMSLNRPLDGMGEKKALH